MTSYGPTEVEDEIGRREIFEESDEVRVQKSPEVPRGGGRGRGRPRGRPRGSGRSRGRQKTLDEVQEEATPPAAPRGRGRGRPRGSGLGRGRGRQQPRDEVQEEATSPPTPPPPPSPLSPPRLEFTEFKQARWRLPPLGAEDDKHIRGIRKEQYENWNKIIEKYAAESEDDDEGSFAVDDEEEWDVPKRTDIVEWKNSKFKQYKKVLKTDDEIATMITEVMGKEDDSAAEDVIDFPDSDEDDDNFDPDARNSSDEVEDEEEDEDEDNVEEGQDRARREDGGEDEHGEGDETDSSESGVSEPNDEGRDDETMTILSTAGGRADLRTVVDEFHQEPPEETVAGNRFSTPQKPKASFLSACSSNTSSSSDEFFSPGKKKRGRNRGAAETDAEDGKDEYLLVDRLICNADNCQSGRLTNLPDIYCDKGTQFMCNDCLLQASGHRECMTEGCQICKIVGQELGRRLQLEKSFCEGSLILEETISKQPGKTATGPSESVLSSRFRFASPQRSLSPSASINSSRRKKETIPRTPAQTSAPATPPPRRLPLAQSTPATIPKRKKFLLGSARRRDD